MPLGQAILRTMLDLNPCEYVIIVPCCPQMLKKYGSPAIAVPGLPSEWQARYARCHSLGRPGLNNPSEATTILTQGAAAVTLG